MAGGLACPGCSGVLAGWGYARARRVRGPAGVVQVRPRRARCTGCEATHVLLPVGLLLRRADGVVVIGGAVVAQGGGGGWRGVAGGGGRGGGVGGGRVGR